MPIHELTPRSPHVFVRQPTTRSVPRAGAAGLGAPTGPTVAWTIDRFLACVDDGSARDRYGRHFTRDDARGLRWHLRAHLAQARGDCRLRQLDRADIEALLQELRAAGLPHDRLQDLARSVRALYDHALERQLVDRNPAECLAIPVEHDAGPPSSRSGSADRSRLLARVRVLVRVVTLACLLAAIVFLGAAL
jgi:hypothetical protein